MSSIVDEVRPHALFVFRKNNACLLAGLDGLEEPDHVGGQGAHGLQAFLVLADVVGREAVDLVPVLGGNNGHVVHEEILVEAVEGCGCTAAAAGNHSCGQLALQAGACAEAEAVQNAADLGGCAAVVNGRAHNDAVELIQTVDDLVDQIVEDAAAGFCALAAVDAAVDGFGAHPHDFGFDAVLVQNACHLIEGGIAAAVLMGAAVEKQYLCHNKPPV